MTLRDYLKSTNIQLTSLEVRTLECILGQGSFYEEAGSEEGSFIGWEIYEHEVKGCRGSLASLVKKEIIDIDYDEDCAAYYTKHKLEFDRTKGYHKLLLDEGTVK